MTKYIETLNVQPTATKTILIKEAHFSWAPQGDRLAKLGVVEVPEEKKASAVSKEAGKRSVKQ
jgi:hypothetical protein